MFVNFIKKLIHEVVKDDVISLANELTYKFIMAMFPFIIFLMAILGFLNIDGNVLLSQVSLYVPPQIFSLIHIFVDEVIETRSLSLLSTSLLVSLMSTSSGVRAVMRGINKAYGHKETRHFVIVWIISVLLVFVFVAAILLLLILIIFEDNIKSMLHQYLDVSVDALAFIGSIGFLLTVCLLLILTMIINRISSSKKVTFAQAFPGSAISVALWIGVSEIFNLYVNNYSNYSKIYGSIGSIFILLLWLNMNAIFLLIGSEINGLLFEGRS